jgi:hypothetical protein
LARGFRVAFGFVSALSAFVRVRGAFVAVVALGVGAAPSRLQNRQPCRR